MDLNSMLPPMPLILAAIQELKDANEGTSNSNVQDFTAEIAMIV